MDAKANPPGATPSSTRIPVSVLTGFLGSGKTTVLNKLIRHPSFDNTLVIINEFGEIGLDHELVAHSRDDVVVEMSSGCLCCTIRGDLVRTLREATWRFAREGRQWFDRVIIETTGLADPAPILHTLMTDPLIAARYRLDGVIATVDAATGPSTLDRQIEAVKQAAVADRLLLTKTDLVSEGATRSLEATLRGLNPAAPILKALNGDVDPSRLFDAGLYDPSSKTLDVQRWLNAEAYPSSPGAHAHGHHGEAEQGHGDEAHHHDVNRHDAHIHALCLAFDQQIQPVVLNAWLAFVTGLLGPDLYRLKGIVNLAGAAGPVVIHGVQHVFHPSVTLPTWPSDDRRTRLVFIGRDLPESDLRKSLALFSGEAPVIQLPDETGGWRLEGVADNSPVPRREVAKAETPAGSVS